MSDEAMNLRDETDLIRQAFTYAQRFRGSTFVFRIGARLIDGPSFPGLLRDLALLHENGIRIVLVPSGGTRIDELLAIYGIETRRVDGLRISPPEAMPLIQMAAFDTATRLMNQLARNGVEAVVGNWVRARAYGVRKGVDFQRTGIVDKVDVDLLKRSMDDDFVPILPCIGWSVVGDTYNISSIELATQLAVGLKARKLFFLTEGEPLSLMLLDPSREGVAVRNGCVSRLTPQAADSVARDESLTIAPVDRDMLKHSVAACRGGVERVHFIDGDMEGGVLKEIFSTLGYGIMVHGDPFENIRPMRQEDIPEILRIMEPSIEQGILVRRTESDLQRKCPDYAVFESDGTVRGCGALHRYGLDMAEIAGIAVDENFGHMGIGRKIVHYLIGVARKLGLASVFLLTTRTADWFQKLGFAPGGVDDLPEERRETYDQSRKSRIYVYSLTRPDEDQDE
ncbi:MAG: amino-acid N-acetyltransferase [Spirochaetaceae bacterium]|nr:amino-acid N-acetyltransferase [Spirochaetaceae bacterium]